MQKIKKIVALLSLTLIIVINLCACSNKPKQSEIDLTGNYQTSVAYDTTATMKSINLYKQAESNTKFFIYFEHTDIDDEKKYHVIYGYWEIENSYILNDVTERQLDKFVKVFYEYDLILNVIYDSTNSPQNMAATIFINEDSYKCIFNGNSLYKHLD